MKKFLILVALIFAFAPATLRAQGNHEYEQLEEKTINYKDWTFSNLKDGMPVNLRSFAQGKKLVLVIYFANWCPNWRNEAPGAAALYEKYKDKGLAVIGISEYGSRVDSLAFFGAQGPPYTVVSESESRDDKEKTTHYTYRQASGDLRRWGSPYNVFLEPAKLNKTGDVLTEKAWIVNGELIEADVEKFVREHLGLDTPAPARTTSNFKLTTDKDKLMQETKASDPTQCSPASSSSSSSSSSPATSSTRKQ